MNIFTIVIFLITYFICSINPAIIICKKVTGQDIRKLGSGNAGSANAMRVLGRVRGTIVVVLDVAKVLLSFGIVNILCKWFDKEVYSSVMTAFMLASVIGHVFPIYYKFRGGKGVVVSCVLAFLLDPKIAAISVIVAVIVMLITKIVSAGSIAGVVLYNLISLFFVPQHYFAVLVASLIILYKHRENVQRLLAKQEVKFKL